MTNPTDDVRRSINRLTIAMAILILLIAIPLAALCIGSYSSYSYRFNSRSEAKQVMDDNNRKAAVLEELDRMSADGKSQEEIEEYAKSHSPK
jgi:hypothetical protein